MNILTKIIDYKKIELKKKKELTSVAELEENIFFNSTVFSLSQQLLDENKSGIIAEIKRKSPSKGMIHEFPDLEEISVGYTNAGAAAISVLTDEHFFGGSSKNLIEVRHYNACPILRKDFIFDEYQIIEAKSIGADAILLIASILSSTQTKQLASFANSLGLEVLLEVHTEEEAQKYPNEFTKLVGVNNRNLDDFSVNIQTSKDLSKIIPNDFIKVSESGINDPKTIIALKEYGYKGFLMGEYFMQSDMPHKKCAAFINALNAMEESK